MTTRICRKTRVSEVNLPRHTPIRMKEVTIPSEIMNMICAHLDRSDLQNISKTCHFMARAALDSGTYRINRFVILFIQNIRNISPRDESPLKVVLQNTGNKIQNNFREIYEAKTLIINEIEKEISTSIQSGVISDLETLKQIVAEAMQKNQIKELFQKAITFPTSENTKNLFTKITLLITREKEINQTIETTQSIQNRETKLNELQRLAEYFADAENIPRLEKIVSMIYETWDEDEDTTPLYNLFATLLNHEHFLWASEIAVDLTDTDARNQAFEMIYQSLLEAKNFLLAIMVINNIPDLDFQDAIREEIHQNIILFISELANLTNGIEKDKETYKLCLCLIELEQLLEATQTMKTISDLATRNLIFLAIQNNLLTALDETLKMENSPEKDQEMVDHCKCLVELNMPGASDYALMIANPELQVQILGFIAERTGYLG